MEELSIILPVFNEKRSIGIVLKEWHNLFSKFKFSYSFIICEDGSTDGTKEVLKKLIKKYPIILNQKVKRRGYAKAIIAGILSSRSRYILCIDSDGQCDPEDFLKLWNYKKQAQILIGNRIRRIDNMQRLLFSYLFRLFFRLLFPNKISDPSAPFVLFKRKTILPYKRFLSFLREGFWWGFIAICLKEDLSVMEIPINHRKRLLGDTQIYHPKVIPGIAIRNMLSLIKLKIAR